MRGDEVAVLFTEQAKCSPELWEYGLDDMEQAVQCCLFLMGK